MHQSSVREFIAGDEVEGLEWQINKVNQRSISEQFAVTEIERPEKPQRSQVDQSSIDDLAPNGTKVEGVERQSGQVLQPSTRDIRRQALEGLERQSGQVH
jgi:hypothetical protein